jgi:hypothetical protein
MEHDCQFPDLESDAGEKPWRCPECQRLWQPPLPTFNFENGVKAATGPVEAGRRAAVGGGLPQRRGHQRTGPGTAPHPTTHRAERLTGPQGRRYRSR